MNLPFVDREQDLSSLEKWYSKKGFAFAVIYGRRRVGKTYLLKRFLEGKKGLYFLCDKAGTERNAIRLKRQIAEHLGDQPIESNELDDLFSNLRKKITGRTVVVLDEFPYLIEKDDSIPSVFQRIVDETLSGSDMMLIICGSSISMMEEGVLSSKSPLYGRRTGHRRINPIPFRSISELLPRYDVFSIVEAQASLGSIPYHLCMVDDSRSVKENLVSLVMTRDGALYEEVDFLLRQELRDPDVYKAVISSISAGNHRLVDISDKAGIPKGDLPKYLGKLIKLGILKKEYSITDRKKSRSLYILDDNFFHFWFTFCEPYKSDLEIGDLTNPTDNMDKMFNTFVGRRFECLVRNELLRDILPFSPSKLGRYWSGGEEIDAVAIDQSGKRAAFVEIKWSKVDPDRELKELERKVERFPWEFEKRDLFILARDLKKEHPSCFDLDQIMV
jgi:AAA+ ATPase superfamily predicted ATPase